MTRSSARPPVLAGYEHIDDLGSGGYADVYLYEQAMPRRRVAVKVLRSESLTDELAMQFTSEANLMAALSTHPYIVTIYGAAVADDGRPYLVMEYYPGPNLSVRCRQKPLGVPEALRIGVQLSGAVETAHRAGILHRDLKPANVLTSAFGKPGLTDFGISAVTGESAASGGLSVPWSPPEALDDAGEIDARSDVWSLGATVYTLLTGHSPFEIPGGDNSSLGVMSRIEHQPLAPVRRSDMPPSLDRTLAAAMSKAPVARPSSAGEFARMLQAVERELRFQPTELDIPEDPAALPSMTAPAPPPDIDEEGTRFRGAVSVDAQPSRKPSTSTFAPTVSGDPRPSASSPSTPVPVTPAPAPPPRLTGRPLPDSGLTVRRGAATASPEPAPLPLAPPRARHAEPDTAPPTRRGWTAAAAVVAVLVVASGVAAFAMSRASSPSPRPSDTGFDPNHVGGGSSAQAAPPPVSKVALEGAGRARTLVVTWPQHTGSPYYCKATDSSNVTVGPTKEQKPSGCVLAVPGSGPVRVTVTAYGQDGTPTSFTRTVGN
jgi:serine/threonine protein kinase